MSWRLEIRHYRTALRRLHRSRGYGIHSPFAFRFVRDVLRGRHCRYYADSELTQLRRRLKRQGVCPLPSSRDVRRLHRVVSHLQPQRVIAVCEELSPLLQTAISLACSRSVVVHCPTLSMLSVSAGDMIIVDNVDDGDAVEMAAEAICSALELDGCVYLKDIRRSGQRALYGLLRSRLHHAQTFSNDRMAVMVCRHDFAQQYYSLWF